MRVNMNGQMLVKDRENEGNVRKLKSTGKVKGTLRKEDKKENGKERIKWEGLKAEIKKNRYLNKLPSELATWEIKPTASLTNDKVEVMLSSLTDFYKEPIDMVEEFKLLENGWRWPRMDVFSFEQIVKHGEVRHFVTVKEDRKEDMKQFLKFAWYRSPLEEMRVDIWEEFKEGELKVEKEEKKSEEDSGEEEKGKVEKTFTIVYELGLEKSSVWGIENERRKENGMWRDILEVSKMLKKEEKVGFQWAMKPAERNWWKDGQELYNQEKKKGDRENKKLSEPVFDVSVRMCVKAETEKRAESLATSFFMVFKQMSSKNTWLRSKVKEKEKEECIEKVIKQRLVHVPMRFSKRLLLSPKELGLFVKMPTKNLQRDFQLKTDDRDAMYAPKLLRDKKAMPIGFTEIGGKKDWIYLPDDNLDDFMKSYCFIGSPRTGKDTSMINFIVEAAKRGHGAIIPDAINEIGNDRGMADSIRDALPEDRIVDLSMDSYDFPLYFGLDDIIEEVGMNGINLMADNLIKILKLDDKYESKKLARLVAKACKCNLYDMYCFVRSKHYQLQVLERVQEEDELLAVQLRYEYIEKRISQNIEGAILSRLDEMMGNDLLKYMFAQEPNKKLSLKQWIKEGKVVIIRMTKTDIGELGTKVLMYLLTTRVFWLKKMMNKHEDYRDKTVFLVYNEFFQYMSRSLEDTLMQMIVECPKYRLGMLFAFHAPTSNQISERFWDTLRAASLNYFLFKNTNSKIYRDMEEQISPIDVSTAMKTEKYESIMIPYVNGKQHDPFFVRMMLPPSKRQKMFENGHLTEEHKGKYGTALGVVKERIKERELSLYQSEEEEDEEE